MERPMASASCSSVLRACRTSSARATFAMASSRSASARV
jgi:hypothetical protein